jgi:sterol desaturase/sphingolipid hydroxylase (fatty acid hydroxylase superfamily)
VETVFNLIESRGLAVTLILLVALLCWEGVHPFFGFFRGHGRERGVHALRNLSLGLINSLMISAFFVGLWLWAAEWAAARDFGLLYLGALPAWAQAIGAVLLLDVWTYWFHRMNHRIPFLWRFHQVHHADREMDVTTANRFHFGEIFISSTLRIGIILLSGIQLWHVALYELIMFPIVQFHHANVALSPGADQLLRTLIATPSMHKVHHSDYQPETDSNYTSLLSVWDRVFGSFRIRADEKNIQFGLTSVDPKTAGRVGRMLRLPFRKR